MRSLLVLEEASAPARRSPRPRRCAASRSSSSRVEPASAGETERVLHALGFAQAGQHRSKPVSCGGRADARVLLNAGARGEPTASPRSPSRAPTRRARPQRAEALLAPVLGRDRGPARGRPRRRRRARRHVGVLLPHRRARADELAAGLRGARAGRRRRTAGCRAHRPRRAAAAVRLLRRGGALLPLRARRSSRATASSSPRPTGSSAAARCPTATAACGSRSTSRCWPATAPGRAPARRLRLRRRARHRRSACASAASRRSRSRRNYYDDLAARSELEPEPDRGDARPRRPLRPGRAAASSCTSTPRWSGAACSSRSCSDAAATTATAPRTHRSACPHSGRRWQLKSTDREETREHHAPRRGTCEDAQEGGARELDRQRPGVLRLLHLRDGRRAGLRQGLLPRVRSCDRHAAVVRHLRRGLRGAADRRLLHGPHRRQVRPQARPHPHRDDDGRVDVPRRLPPRPTTRSALWAPRCSWSCA